MLPYIAVIPHSQKRKMQKMTPDQMNQLKSLTGTENLGKREIVRRAGAVIQERDKRIQNQIKSINRLLERWNLLGIFLDEMEEVFKDRKDDYGLVIVHGIQEEMERLEESIDNN
jgi:hypothetical protein